MFCLSTSVRRSQTDCRRVYLRPARLGLRRLAQAEKAIPASQERFLCEREDIVDKAPENLSRPMIHLPTDPADREEEPGCPI